jgi:hypothetical protein
VLDPDAEFRGVTGVDVIREALDSVAAPLMRQAG